MPTIKARVGSQNVVRVLSNASSPATRLIDLDDVNKTLRTQDGMILVWDVSTESFVMTSVIDSSSTTISGITSLTNTTESSSSTDGALIVSGGVGIGGNLNVAGISTFGTGSISGDLSVDGDLEVAGTSNFIGTATFRGGTINLGDANSDDINVSGEFVSSLVPNDDDTYDLGSSTKRWKNLFTSGITTTNNLFVVGVSTFTNTLNITGFVTVTEGLYYDADDYDGPNGIAYFDNTGKLISADSSSTETLETTNLILTTNASGLPRWSSVIDGGEF